MARTTKGIFYMRLKFIVPVMLAAILVSGCPHRAQSILVVKNAGADFTVINARIINNAGPGQNTYLSGNLLAYGIPKDHSGAAVMPNCAPTANAVLFTLSATAKADSTKDIIIGAENIRDLELLSVEIGGGFNEPLVGIATEDY